MNETRIAERVAGRVMNAGGYEWVLVGVSGGFVELKLVSMTSERYVRAKVVSSVMVHLEQKARGELVEMVKAGLMINMAKVEMGDAMIGVGANGKVEMNIGMRVAVMPESVVTYDDVEEILTAGRWL